MNQIKDSKKKLAIVTVNFNGKQDTLDLLQSFKKLDKDNLELKIVVVDNGSTDGSVTEILKQYPQITLLQTGANLGFTGGHNRGLRYAHAWGAEYTLIINNDTLINSSNLLTSLVQTIENDPQTGIVSPKILFAPGYEFHKERYQQSEQGKVIWYAGGTFDWDNLYSKHRGIDEVDSGKYDKVEKTEFVSGCCLLFKNELFDQVGFFEEKLFAYFEDSDLSKRITKAGYKKYYDGRVSIYHKVSRTSGIGSPTTDYYLTRNRLYFGFKYASTRTKLALLKESLKFLIFGRPMQKKGVFHFLTGTFTPLPSKEFDEDLVEFPTTLSIVTVNYNTADLVKKLLKSIFTNKTGFDPNTMEIIVLDDNSPNDPLPEIKDYLGKISFYKNSENLRFTRSFNRVIHLSKGKYILIMNSDMEILKDCLTELIKTEKQLKDNAVLGGRLYFPDMRSQDSVFYLPTITGAIKEYFFKIKGSYFMYVPKPEKLTRVEGLVGACIFIPRTILNKVGFFNEKLVSYFEDIDYAKRFKQLNIPVYFVPTAKFIHVHGASFKKLEGKAYEILVDSSKKYHGKIYYALLYITLWFCQKLTNTRPDGEVK